MAERLLVPKAETAELAGQLPTMPGPRRCLRIGSAGLLRVDCAAIAVEAKLDGKFLLRGSDPQLSAEDIALGYQQLLHVERGWRDLTAHLELRPRSTTAANTASAPTCSSVGWPLLVRFIGTRTGRTRAAVREDLTGPAGTFIPDQRTHHRHPRGAGRARSPRRGRSCAWIPPPHGARRSRHLLVPSSGNSPKSQVSLLRSKSQETGAGCACHLVLWVASATRVSGEHPARPLILVWPGGRVNH